jgi:nicotinamidase-related amidase
MGSGDAPKRQIGPNAVHLCVDMQRLFMPGAPWGAPWFERRLPAVVALAERMRERTVFTRFIPPSQPEEMPGMWRPYYARWREITAEVLDPIWLRLPAELERLSPPATIIDKMTYSPFNSPQFHAFLRRKTIDTFVISGCESDVCVLAAVLGAIDLGYRVVVVTDAICSSSDPGHDAILSLYHRRFSEQVETASLEATLDAWRA